MLSKNARRSGRQSLEGHNAQSRAQEVRRVAFVHVGGPIFLQRNASQCGRLTKSLHRKAGELSPAPLLGIKTPKIPVGKTPNPPRRGP